MTTKLEADMPDWGAAIGAMAHAKERHRLTGKWRGQFPCPKCKRGTIRWQAMARNMGRTAHTRGSCSTPECIAWIE